MKPKYHYGRPLTLGKAIVINGVFYLDTPISDRTRFNLARLEGKYFKVKAFQVNHKEAQ